MMKIAKELWARNSEKLREKIAKSIDHNGWDYEDLVKMTFDVIFNENSENFELNVESITAIDNGDYQGTIMFLIPFLTYQPSAHEYMMTYACYGSCSYCDTLQGIQDYRSGKVLPTEKQVKGYLCLCKDLVMEAIVPYNTTSWAHKDMFDQVEEE